jgi:hypothetical protein
LNLLRKYSLHMIFFFILTFNISFIAIISSIKLFGWKDPNILSGIISGFLGLFGNIVGGIIAFIIARSQFYQLNNDSIRSQKASFHNILKSLHSELIHNRSIYTAISVRESEQKRYFVQLETDVWMQVRFEACNFLSMEYYSILNDLYNEIKDLKNGTPDYEEGLSDYNSRIIVIDKIISDITELLKKE